MPLPTLLVKGNLVSSNDSLKDIVPIDYILDWFAKRKHSATDNLANRVLILKSKTASGKSTVFPSYLFQKFYKKGVPGIIVTQPRIINAVSIAKDLPNTYKFFRLGENLGYQTKASRSVMKAGLLYSTIGVLTAQMQIMTDDEIMHKYGFIIIDEVHETSLEQFLLLYMLKNFMLRNLGNPRLPFVICMSATFDTSRFIKYFDLPETSLIQVSGFAFPLEEIYAGNVENYCMAAAETVKRIHLENLADEYTRDILIFMPGEQAINETARHLMAVLAELIDKDSPLFKVLIINREAVTENTADYKDVFKPLEKITIGYLGEIFKKISNEKSAKVSAATPFRRVIISTNVAETGVTIDTLKYVIDSGLTNMPEYNPINDVHTLTVKAITRSMALQRAGRANRKAPGIVHRLYTKKTYDELDENPMAQAEVSEISQQLLTIFSEQTINKELISKTLDIDEFGPAVAPVDIYKLPSLLIDTPAYDNIRITLKKLFTLGYIDRRETSLYLSYLGIMASRFSSAFSINQSRMILAGTIFNISLQDLATIAAYLNSGKLTNSKTNWLNLYSQGTPPYFIDKSLHKEIVESTMYRLKYFISDNFMDSLIIYRAASIVLSSEHGNACKEFNEWCASMELNSSEVLKFILARNDMVEELIGIGIDVTKGHCLMNVPEPEFMNYLVGIKHCIYDGFKTNMLILDENFIYKSLNGTVVSPPDIFSSIVQNNILFAKYKIKNPLGKYVIYNKLTTKLVKDADVLYEITADKICLLDGFVNIDNNFYSIK